MEWWPGIPGTWKIFTPKFDLNCLTLSKTVRKKGRPKIDEIGALKLCGLACSETHLPWRPFSLPRFYHDSLVPSSFVLSLCRFPPLLQASLTISLSLSSSLSPFLSLLLYSGCLYCICAVFCDFCVCELTFVMSSNFGRKSLDLRGYNVGLCFLFLYIFCVRVCAIWY